MLHFQNWFLNRASYFLIKFWKMLNAIKVSQRWFMKSDISGHTTWGGYLPVSATSGQTAIMSATITGWMAREQHFCAQVSLRPLPGIRSLNVLWSTGSTEKSECLCLRAHESSELESGLRMIPAPAWRTGNFLECR